MKFNTSAYTKFDLMEYSSEELSVYAEECRGYATGRARIMMHAEAVAADAVRDENHELYQDCLERIEVAGKEFFAVKEQEKLARNIIQARISNSQLSLWNDDVPF